MRKQVNARKVRRAGSESHQLLKPEEIGVQLTEGFVMDPEVHPESFSGPA